MIHASADAADMEDVSKESILVIEDSVTSSRLFCLLLRNAGYDVKSAENVAEAIEVLKEFRPHLILTDILLPGTNGLDFAREIKANPATADITIVALSACNLTSDARRAASVGCSGYIKKPIDPRTFASVVGKYFERPGENASAG